MRAAQVPRQMLLMASELMIRRSLSHPNATLPDSRETFLPAIVH